MMQEQILNNAGIGASNGQTYEAGMNYYPP